MKIKQIFLKLNLKKFAIFLCKGVKMSVESDLLKVKNIKKEIFSAISAKGSDIQADSPFKDYAQKIQEIKSSSGDLNDVKIVKFNPNPENAEMTYKDNSGNDLPNYNNIVVARENDSINYTAKYAGKQDLSGSILADMNKEIQILLQDLKRSMKKFYTCCYGTGSYLILDNGDLYACGDDSLIGDKDSTIHNTITKFTKVAENVRDVCDIDGINVYLTNNNELFASCNSPYFHKSRIFTKVAENVKTIYSGPSNLFYISNDDTLYGVGDNDYSTLGNVEDSTIFTKLAENVEKVDQPLKSATYYLTKSKDLYGAGTSANPGLSSSKLATFTKIQSNVDDFYFEQAKFALCVQSGNYLYVYTDNRINSAKLYIGTDYNTATAKNVSKFMIHFKAFSPRISDGVQTYTITALPSYFIEKDTGYLWYCQTNVKLPSNYLYNPLLILSEKVIKSKYLTYYYSDKDSSLNYSGFAFILTDQNNLYRVYEKNSDKTNYSSTFYSLGEETSSNATTKPELIASNVIDFDVNQYTSSYITSNGDCYVLGKVSGAAGTGSTNSPITSYLKITEFAE